MFDRGAAAPDTAEDEGFESADEGHSDHQPSNFVRPDPRSNSFSDVSLASEGRSSSPVRPLSRLSRQSLAEHHAATNGHSPAVAQAIPSWSRDMEQYQQQNAAGSLEESIPEMLRIKDLDSGKEYNLDKASFAAARMHGFRSTGCSYSCFGVPTLGPLMYIVASYCHMLHHFSAS